MKHQTRTMLASAVRGSLPKLVRDVAKTGEDIEVVLNGKHVARATLKPPKGGIPPMLMKVHIVTPHWSEFINHVYNVGSRWYFEVDETKVYFVRTSEKEDLNWFRDKWLKHKAAHKGNNLSPAGEMEQASPMDIRFEELLDRYQSLLERQEAFAEAHLWPVPGFEYARNQQPDEPEDD